MALTILMWKNKGGTGDRNCKCGSWKQHWLNYSGQRWPKECAVLGCKQEPTLGAHVISFAKKGERIVPMCASCNKRKDSFNLKQGIKDVSANRSETCEKNKFNSLS